MIHYYLCPVLAPRIVNKNGRNVRRDYIAYVADWLMDNAVPGTWVRTQMRVAPDTTGAPARNWCLCLVEADSAVHTLLTSLAGVFQVSVRPWDQTITTTQRNTIRTQLTNRGLSSAWVQTGMTVGDVVQGIGDRLDPGYNAIAERMGRA